MNDQFAGLPATPDIAKSQAKRLRSALAPELMIGHGQALELIARVHGEQSWGRLNSIISAPKSEMPATGVAGPTNVDAGAQASRTLPGNHVEQRVLQALWKGFEHAGETQVTPKTRAKAKELLKQEIISSISLEDWLDTLDRNLGDMVFHMGAENLLKISRVATVSRFPRPSARDKGVSGTQGLRPAAFAAVLIWLERLGFDTHPEVFYEPLLEWIKRAKYLDSEELTCLWHAKERKRFQTSESFVDVEAEIENSMSQVVKGRHGLTIEVTRGADPQGPIKSLSIYR